MAKAKTDQEIAQILFGCQFATSDAIVAERYGVSVRSIERWRHRAKNDPKLSEMVGKMAAIVRPPERTWMTQVDAVFLKALDRMGGLIEECDDLSKLIMLTQVFGEIVISRQVLTESPVEVTQESPQLTEA